LSPFDLTGRVAIVTGGNGGLGLAMALGFARAGAAIAIAARDEEKGEAAIRELTSFRARCRFYSFQASSASSCQKLVEGVVSDFSRCDILVNNAGMNVRKAPEEISEGEWHEIIDVRTPARACALRATVTVGSIRALVESTQRSQRRR
jgi:2-dehydro-3-deoxy-D-gluconate 5-dehydrogenase